MDKKYFKNGLIFTNFGNLTENELHSQLKDYGDENTTVKEYADFIGISSELMLYYLKNFDIPYKKQRRSISIEERIEYGELVNQYRNDGYTYKQIGDKLSITDAMCIKYERLYRDNLANPIEVQHIKEDDYDEVEKELLRRPTQEEMDCVDELLKLYGIENG